MRKISVFIASKNSFLKIIKSNSYMLTPTELECAISKRVSRILLRKALSSLGDVCPNDWIFERDASGNLQQINKKGFYFSISYARDIVVVATTNFSKIGVDVEVINQKFTISELYPILSKKEIIFSNHSKKDALFFLDFK